MTSTVDTVFPTGCQERNSGRRYTFPKCLLQLPTKFGRVLVTMDRHRMLHRNFHQLFLAVSGNRNRALRLTWKLPTVDVFARHICLLVFGQVNIGNCNYGIQQRLAEWRTSGVPGVVACAEPVDHNSSLVTDYPRIMTTGQ